MSPQPSRITDPLVASKLALVCVRDALDLVGDIQDPFEDPFYDNIEVVRYDMRSIEHRLGLIIDRLDQNESGEIAS